MRLHAKAHFVKRRSLLSNAIAFLLAVLILAGGLTGCSGSDKPADANPEVLQEGSQAATLDRNDSASESAGDANQQAGNDEASPTTVPAATSHTPVIALPRDEAEVLVVPLGEIANEILHDSAACQKYVGSWVEVTGLVKGMRQNFWPGHGHLPLLHIIDPEAEDTVRNNFMVLNMALDHPPWDQASVGDMVTIRGAMYMGSTPGLVECRIVESAGEPTPNLTVEELRELYDTDRAGFIEQYKEKLIIISGVFTGRVFPEGFNPEEGFNRHKSDEEGWAVLEGETGQSLHLYLGQYNFSDDLMNQQVWAIVKVNKYANPEEEVEEIIVGLESITEVMQEMQ